MLPKNQEERVLRLALSKGLISSSDLEAVSRLDSASSTGNPNNVTWSSRIDKLLRKGYLDKISIETLVQEVENLQELENQSSISSTLFNAFNLRSYSSSKSIKKSLEFPVSNWDKYEHVEFLGSGGMGKVYKARDLKLKRYVALKFLHNTDPEMIERFFQEAQAQAIIEHPNVCKVFEVGEVQDNPYIAMQYIDGQSLKEIKTQLTLEQKVRAIKETAEALHAAHRLGLIHRDVKPANIMVEKREDGVYQSYVMDFGLVKDIGQKGETQTGAILGTPAYMSPEQARGEINRLDRRADIYSLGATLYDLLTGHAPFDGSQGHTILIKLFSEDPEPVRKKHPNIPIDLEAIVMKCLEKEPQQRYESAKALAEDLSRYLDGETVQARKVSWLYLTNKKIKRHKALVTVITIAVLLLAALTTTALQQKYQSDKKAALAQKFGQEVRSIEGILQRAYLLPLHDTKRERKLVEAKINKIAQDMQSLGFVAQSSGNYAIGRGYLALHKYELAYEHLNKAWASGEQNSQVAYALGLTLGELYKKDIEELNNSLNQDVDIVKARKIEIEKKFREPALFYLKESRKAGAETVSPTYVEGLIAFYDQDYKLAQEKALKAFEEDPGFYEAKKLQGDILLMQAAKKIEEDDYKIAEEIYQQAGEIYKSAMNIARSDPSIYLSECDRCILK